MQKAFQRLCVSGRLVCPRQGFYVIVPLEYEATGTPPVEWFIDDLMRYLDVPYYVGCLSAAGFYGAAHQRIQEMQVVVPRSIRMIDRPVLRIRFLQNNRMASVSTCPRRTQTGDIPVSTPEWTSLDLVRFQRIYGGLSVTATVLSELVDALDPERLAEACCLERCTAYIQRLGWLLEHIGCRKLADVLQPEINRREPSFVRLNASLSEKHGTRDIRWRVLVNDRLEADI